MLNMTNSFKLLYLPNEILTSIIIFLSKAEMGRSSLLKTGRTCHPLQLLVEPLVYGKLCLLQENDDDDQ